MPQLQRYADTQSLLPSYHHVYPASPLSPCVSSDQSDMTVTWPPLRECVLKAHKSSKSHSSQSVECHQPVCKGLIRVYSTSNMFHCLVVWFAKNLGSYGLRNCEDYSERINQWVIQTIQGFMWKCLKSKLVLGKFKFFEHFDSTDTIPVLLWHHFPRNTRFIS